MKFDRFFRNIFEVKLESVSQSNNLNDLLTWLHYKKNSKIRSAAAKRLGEIFAIQAIDELIHALNDEDVEVRLETILALKRIIIRSADEGEWIDYEEITDALVKALNDVCLEVRVCAGNPW